MKGIFTPLHCWVDRRGHAAVSPTNSSGILFPSGAGWTRTSDRRIMSPLL
jgi:hypothetical protein